MQDLNATNSEIVWEASDLERGVGAILFHNEESKRFQLHIYNDEDSEHNQQTGELLSFKFITMDLSMSDLVTLVREVYPLFPPEVEL